MPKTILDYIGLKLTRLSTKLKSTKPDYKPFSSGDNAGKSVLLIDFNTESGITDIEIPLE